MERKKFKDVKAGDNLYLYDFNRNLFATCNDVVIRVDEYGEVYMQSAVFGFDYNLKHYYHDSAFYANNTIIAVSEEALFETLIGRFKRDKIYAVSELKECIKKLNMYEGVLKDLNYKLNNANSQLYMVRVNNMSDSEFIEYYNSYILRHKKEEGYGFIVKLDRKENNNVDWISTINGIKNDVLSSSALRQLLEDMMKYRDFSCWEKYVMIFKEGFKSMSSNDFEAFKITMSENRVFLKSVVNDR